MRTMARMKIRGTYASAVTNCCRRKQKMLVTRRIPLVKRLFFRMGCRLK